MGKVKSIIITSLLVIAIIVAGLFATVSFTGGINRLDSIASSISLNADLSGYATATLYPENVVSAQKYKSLEADEQSEYYSVGGVYVKASEYGEEQLAQLKKDVLSDAAILNNRFSEKGYSGYSVSVEDEITVKVNIPSAFSYSDYAYAQGSSGYEPTTYQSRANAATSAIVSLVSDGKLTLRTTDSTVAGAREDDYTDKALVSSTSSSQPTYVLTKKLENASDFFSEVTNRTAGTTPVITLKLTSEGRSRIKTITGNLGSNTLYFFVGGTQLLSVSVSSAIDTDKLELQASDKATAENVAITLNSAVNGGELKIDYQDIDDVTYTNATMGANAALFALIACAIALVAVIALFIIKYKKLGIAVGLVLLVMPLVLIYAIYLIGIQLSIAAIISCFAGLVLLCASNLMVFAEVRRHTQTGKTMQSSVKTAYKRTFMSVTDMHFILFVVSLITTLVAVGEVSACAFIILISTIASYVLFWTTRFMWYVLSGPVKDKFGFAGFKRVIYDD